MCWYPHIPISVSIITPWKIHSLWQPWGWMLSTIPGFKFKFIYVTQWWYYTTAPGTLGDTRHLLGLVSLGTWIEGFEQNREELNVYHLLAYYLLKHSRCQVPDIKHHMVTTHHITNSPYHQPLCKQNNNNNVNPLSPLMSCTSITCIIFTS